MRYRLKSDLRVECDAIYNKTFSNDPYPWVLVTLDAVPLGGKVFSVPQQFFDASWEPVPEPLEPLLEELVEDELDKMFAGGKETRAILDHAAAELRRLRKLVEDEVISKAIESVFKPLLAVEVQLLTQQRDAAQKRLDIITESGKAV